MRERRDLFSEHLSIGQYVLCAHFQEVVEATCNHVALLDLRQLLNSGVERSERRFPRVVQFDLHKGNMAHIKPRRVQHRLKPENIPILNQLAQAHSARSLRQANLPGQFSHRQTTIPTQSGKYLSIIAVKFTVHAGNSYFLDRIMEYLWVNDQNCIRNWSKRLFGLWYSPS